MDLEEQISLEPPKVRNCKGLSREDLRRELQFRDLPAIGIQGEDEQTLQKAYDAEYEQELEEYRLAQQERAQRILAEQDRLRDEQRRLVHEREDEQLVANNGKLRLFLQLARNNQTAPEVHFIGGPAMARVLAHALPNCTSLMALDLSNGQVKNEGARALGLALGDPQTHLRRLELSRSEIGPEGLVSIGEGLSENDTLLTLILEDNNLTDDGHDWTGIESFSEALVSNSTLTCINLSRSNLGQRGVALLARRMTKNQTVRSMDLEFNGLPLQSDMDIILQKLDENKELYETTMAETHARLRVERQQLAVIELEQKREDDRLREEQAAHDRAAARQAERLRKFEQAKADRSRELEEGKSHAYERHAAFMEAELASKKKGKKK